MKDVEGLEAIKTWIKSLNTDQLLEVYELINSGGYDEYDEIED